MVNASVCRAGSRPFFASIVLTILSACGSGGPSTGPPPPTSANGFLYVVSAGDSPSSAGAIYTYELFIDSVAKMSPAPLPTGVSPAAIAVRDGYAYVVNVGDGTISQYGVAQDGTLTALTPATVANPGQHTLGAAHASALIDATGSFLYVTNATDGTLSQFSIGSDGLLTPMTPSTVATGLNPVAIAQTQIVDNPSAYYVLNSGATGDTGTVSLYSSDMTGALTLQAADTVAAGTNPTAIAVDATSTMAYVVSNCDGSQCLGSIRQFAVGANGALTDTGDIVTTGSHYEAVNLAIGYADNSDAGVYVLSNALNAGSNPGALWQYALNGGQLAAVTPSNLSTGPVAVAQVAATEAPDFLYVLTANSADATTTGGSIAFFSQEAGGTLSLTATATVDVPHPVAMGLVVLLPP